MQGVGTETMTMILLRHLGEGHLPQDRPQLQQLGGVRSTKRAETGLDHFAASGRYAGQQAWGQQLPTGQPGNPT